MEAIAIWLRQPQDYAHGVALYNKYGSSEVLKLMLSVNESSYNREKLIAALTEILEAANVTEADPVISHKAQTDPSIFVRSSQKTGVTVEPKANSQQPTAKLKELYQRQSNLHSKLKLLAAMNHPQSELQPICFEILNIGKEIRQIKLIQREIERTGKLPDHLTALEDLPPDKQYRKLMNNRSYISKFEEDDAKQEELERRIMENHQLEKILNIKN